MPTKQICRENCLCRACVQQSLSSFQLPLLASAGLGGLGHLWVVGPWERCGYCNAVPWPHLRPEPAAVPAPAQHSLRLQTETFNQALSAATRHVAAYFDIIPYLSLSEIALFLKEISLKPFLYIHPGNGVLVVTQHGPAWCLALLAQPVLLVLLMQGCGFGNLLTFGCAPKTKQVNGVVCHAAANSTIIWMFLQNLLATYHSAVFNI